MIKKIWNNLPQLSIVIILLSLLKIFLYYNNFNLPIKYYIGLSELGLLIAEDLFIMVPMILYMYFITLRDRKRELNINQNNLKSPTKSAIDKFRRSKVHKFLSFFMPYLLIGIFILVLIGFPLFFIFNGKSTYSDRIISFSILFLIFSFYMIFIKNSTLEKYFTPLEIDIAMFFILFLLFFGISTAKEIESVEKGKFIGTNIITKDSTYNSTGVAFYIGQTSEYVFFHNKKDNHTTILPTSEVLKIELYSK